MDTMKSPQVFFPFLQIKGITFSFINPLPLNSGWISLITMKCLKIAHEQVNIPNSL